MCGTAGNHSHCPACLISISRLIVRDGQCRQLNCSKVPLGVFFFCHQPAMHLFLHPDSLLIRNPASLIVLTDSLPLQERCKWEELWVGCYLAAPGSHPADNMLALSDESGSLCWTICFGFCLLVQNKTILNKAWRTRRRCFACLSLLVQTGTWLQYEMSAEWPDTGSGKFYMSVRYFLL